MTYQEEAYDAGRHLGTEGAEHVAGRAEAYCECERDRIALVNAPRIMELEVHGSHLTERKALLKERLRHAAPPGFVRHRKRSAAYYWGTGIALTLAAFFFSLIGFAPYRLGWAGWLYCFGIATITPFAVEEFLGAWRSERLIKGIVTALFLSAVVGGALLAEIRADLLAHQTAQSDSAVVIEGDDAAPTHTTESFYDSTRDLLRAMMVLFAFAIDIGAGIAIHRAIGVGTVSGEDADALLRELGDVRAQIGATAAEIIALTNAPAVFVARFWRDFYRAMLTRTARKAVIKILEFSLCLWMALDHHASAQTRLNLAVALDLSASEATQGPDGKTPFDRNVAGVARLLGTLPASSHVTVIGITADSVADPTPILSASLSADEGYFGERLAAGRRELVRAWHARAARLTSAARGTDIIGSLFLAGELLRSAPRGSPKALVIFSDMRNATKTLNLEARHPGTAGSILAVLTSQHQVADLAGVSVYVVGANGGGKDIREWQEIREFWTRYFAEAGARCAGYSILSVPPALGR